MHDLAVADIEACGEMRIAIERRQAVVGELDDEGQRGVVERLRRSHWHRTGHVGDAIVDNAVILESRVGVRRRPRRLEAPALVDRHVNQHGAPLHVFEHVAAHELRR
jgi:hypothetical protein